MGTIKTSVCRSIIGIFDMDKATVSQITRKFLSGIQKKNKLTAVTGEIPKSFILTDRRQRIHVSDIAVRPQGTDGAGRSKNSKSQIKITERKQHIFHVRKN